MTTPDQAMREKADKYADQHAPIDIYGSYQVTVNAFLAGYQQGFEAAREAAAMECMVLMCELEIEDGIKCRDAIRAMPVPGGDE